MREALGKLTSASSTTSTQTVPHWITSFSAGTPMSTRVSSEPIIARDRGDGSTRIQKRQNVWLASNRFRQHGLILPLGERLGVRGGAVVECFLQGLKPGSIAR